MIDVAEQLVGSAESARFVTRWQESHRLVSDEIRAGRRTYIPSENIHAEALRTTAEEHGVTLDEQTASRWSTFGRRLEPFAEVPAALEGLARDHRLIGLTNAGHVQAFEMSGFARLRWTTLLSSESVGTFKPDPRMYAYAVDTLALTPETCLFVAAHPWDLDAASQHGFRTAYVDRSNSPADEINDFARRFDLVCSDLTSLSSSLGGR